MFFISVATYQNKPDQSDIKLRAILDLLWHWTER